MAQDYYSLVTTIGRSKEALGLADPAQRVELTHIALGDGDRWPTGAEANLLSEQWRGEIATTTVDPDDPTAVQMTVIVPAGAGDFIIREAAVIDADGDMFAIVRGRPVPVSPATSGFAAGGLYRVWIKLAEAASVVVRVNPDILFMTEASYDARWASAAETADAAVERRMIDPMRLWSVLDEGAFDPSITRHRVPHLAVDAIAAEAPAAPAAGATCLVAAGAAGAFAGHDHELAQYVDGAWRFFAAPAATIVGAADTGAYWRRCVDGWELHHATTETHGLVRLATAADVEARSATTAVTPASLAAARTPFFVLNGVGSDLTPSGAWTQVSHLTAIAASFLADPASSLAGSQFVVGPADAGNWKLTVYLAFEAPTDPPNSNWRAAVAINGVTGPFETFPVYEIGTFGMSFSRTLILEAGDIVSVGSWQNTGGTKSLSAAQFTGVRESAA